MKKVCKKCKIFVTGQTCPLCKGKEFTESWQGRVNITDPLRSEIAKMIGITAKGEYAIKTR